ncbi:transglutaminase domain-containing protein [Serinibacter salmoneus]|uniref:Transglutaminase superfamily protein n=1 Tax=Serinibacter salmoneus TaxID=556530 RepID=A0A2A9D252_9MICO|nr:transglutaminase domain-containing protein [Serinibacter salmoneus]PFG20777.1 transglutaminase superfamily protein [Serinibacter salmoneus]
MTRPSSASRLVRRSVGSRALAPLACLLAMAPLIPAYRSATVVLIAVAGVTAGSVLAAVCERRGWGIARFGLALVACYAAGYVLVVAPPIAGRTWWQSLTGAATGWYQGWKDALTLQAPLGSAPQVAVVPWVIGLTTSAVAGLVVARSRGSARRLAVLLPVGAMLLSLVLTDRSPLAPAVVGSLLILLVVLWARTIARPGRLHAHRPRAMTAALVIPLALGVGVALLVPLQPRLVIRDHVAPPVDISAWQSPLAQFRSYVGERAEDHLFTATGLPAGTRMRIAVMDTYDGVTWRSSPAAALFRHWGGRDESALGAAGPVAAAEVVEVEVVLEALETPWLPTVGDPVDLDATEALAPTIRYNALTGTALSLTGMAPGERLYLETVLPPSLEDADLEGLDVRGDALEDLAEIPEVVGVVAREWTAAATTPAQAARELETRLSGTGYYSDGASALDSPAGHGLNRMLALLGADSMVGNDEQYASLMALMARELGLPSRVVMGFTVVDGEVRGQDVTAWVEIAYESAGWVAYDPTPPRSRTPAEQQEQVEPDPEPRNTPAAPTAPEPAQPPTQEPVEVPPEDSEQDLLGASGWLAVTVRIAAVLGVLLLVSLPLLVILALKARRERRRRRAADPDTRALGAWQQALDLARDLGVRPGPAMTRRERAHRVARELDLADTPSTAHRGQPVVWHAPAPGEVSPLEEDLDLLARTADAASFAPDALAPGRDVDAWDALERVRAGALRERSAIRRWRARLSRASLRAIR